MQRRQHELRGPRLFPSGTGRRSRGPGLSPLAPRPGPDGHPPRPPLPPGTGCHPGREAAVRGRGLPGQLEPPVLHVPGRRLRPGQGRTVHPLRGGLGNHERRHAQGIGRKHNLQLYELNIHLSPFPGQLLAFLRRRQGERRECPGNRRHPLRASPAGAEGFTLGLLQGQQPRRL